MTCPPPQPASVFALFRLALEQMGPATTAVGGHLAVEVEGAGRQVVDLGVPGGRWSGDPEEPAVSAVAGTVDALLDLLMAPTRIPDHVGRGHLRLEGDRELVARLASMLRRSGVPLSLRGRSNPC